VSSANLIRGRVIHGNHLGRTLGFPTANLELSGETPFLLPPGVYAVKVEHAEGVYQGMANAGLRPTIDGKALTVEVHLFDFEGDLYGKSLTVQFLEKIRDEHKFDSLGQLADQLQKDKQTALALLS
jgi:riboflavin kinase/FMN adenylyltransferase